MLKEHSRMVVSEHGRVSGQLGVHLKDYKGLRPARRDFRTPPPFYSREKIEKGGALNLEKPKGPTTWPSPATPP